MNKKVNLQTILIVLMVCVTVFISTNTFVNAQMGGNDATLVENAPQSEIMLDPVPGGPGFIMVSAFDFKSYDSVYSQAYSGLDLYNPSTTSQTFSVAGLTLPHGATITKLTLYYYDNSSSNMTLLFDRVPADSSSNRLVQVLSEGAQSAFRTVSQTNISYAIVDNQNFSYYLAIVIPQNVSSLLTLRNVRIDYEYTSNLPAVMKN